MKEGTEWLGAFFFRLACKSFVRTRGLKRALGAFFAEGAGRRVPFLCLLCRLKIKEETVRPCINAFKAQGA